MDIKANIMSPASNETPQPKQAVKAGQPGKTAKTEAKNGAKETAKDKDAAEFDAVLEKSKADSEPADDTAPTESVATTPLTAELAAAAQLLEKVLPLPDKATVKEMPAGSVDKPLIDPGAQLTAAIAAASLNAPVVMKNAVPAEQLTKDTVLSAADAKAEPDALPSSPAKNLSLETLLPQNKQTADSNQQLLDLLNGKAMPGTAQSALPASQPVIGVPMQETPAIVPSQILVQAQQQVAVTEQAGAAAQPTAASQLAMPAQVGAVRPQPKNVSLKDEKNNTTEKTTESPKDAVQENLTGQLQQVNLVVDDKVKPAATPLLQQLQNMQAAAAKQVDEQAPGKLAAEATAPKTDADNSSAQSAQFAFQLSQTTDEQQTVQQMQQTKAAAGKYDIPKQIVEQARLIKTAENTQMVIKLNPEHLGELVLKVSVSSNGAVNASFHSDSAEVRTAIENSLVQLKQEMQSQGLKIDNVGVYAGLGDSLPKGQSGQEEQQQAGTRNRHRQIDLADFEDEVSSVGAVAESMSNDGVDYRI